MKNSLKKKGLSMSSAQSISNLCNQRAIDLGHKLNSINNVKKSFKHGNETITETVGKPLPQDLTSILTQKANLHAVQGFLMENIKAKDEILKEIRKRVFVYDVLQPERPQTEYANILKPVDETWAKGQLTLDEVNELYAVEAMASHIGQFIHKDSVLDRLRAELPNIKPLEWISIKDGERTPVTVETHHTQEQLLTVHEELSGLHRNANKRVNYFKAKIKDLVTTKNGEIAELNANEEGRVNAINKERQEAYAIVFKEWNGEYLKASQKFEAARNKEIQATASLKIEVSARFKPLVDEFLAQLDEE